MMTLLLPLANYGQTPSFSNKDFFINAVQAKFVLAINQERHTLFQIKNNLEKENAFLQLQIEFKDQQIEFYKALAESKDSEIKVWKNKHQLQQKAFVILQKQSKRRGALMKTGLVGTSLTIVSMFTYSLIK